MKSLVQKVLIFAIVMAVVAGSCWMLRKAYRRATQHRLLTQAREYIDKKDYKDAMLCLQRSIQVNKYGVEPRRMMADLYDSLELPMAVDLREGVVNLQDNATNRLMWAQTAIKFKNLTAAQTALRGVPPSSRDTADFYQLVAALDWSAGFVREAETNYQAAYRLDPADQGIALNLATLHLASTNPAVADAARTTLEQVPASSSYWLVAAHQLLSDAIRHKQLSKSLGISEQIVQSPMANFGDKVEYLELLRVAKDPRFAPYLVSIKAEAVKSPHTAFALGQWMMQVDGAPQALGWLQGLPQDIQTNPPVPLLITECQVATKDWKGVLELTGQQDWHELNYYRYALESYAESSLGQTYQADNSWSRALREATHQTTWLFKLSEVTGQWGWDDRRLEVLDTVMEQFPKEKWAQEQYAAVLYKMGRTKALGDFYAKLYAKNPDDVRLKNNVASLDLLLNADLQNCHRLAKEAYYTATNDPSFATTYALSLCVQGRMDEAVQVLNGINPEYLRNPSIAVYYGYIQAKAGNKNLAKAPIQRVSDLIASANAHKMPPILLPEEMEMVRSAQASL